MTKQATTTFEASPIVKHAIEWIKIRLDSTFEVAEYIFWEMYVQGSNTEDIVFEETTVAHYADTKLTIVAHPIPSNLCILDKHFKVTREVEG